MVNYVETRSARAIAIDKALVARTRFEDFNSVYARSPNRSDVNGYDTPQIVVPPPSARVPVPTRIIGEYVPTGKEREKLLPHFYELSEIEQHKDLLVTKNVIRKKEDVHLWKKNPKYYDIRGIDTQPPELLQERIRVATGFAGNPTIIEGGQHFRGNPGTKGYYASHRYNPNYPGEIHYRSGLTEKERYGLVLPHEVGHAFDRNLIGKGTSHGGNVHWTFSKSPRRALGVPQLELRKKILDQVKKVTSSKINPYDPEKASPKFVAYRNANDELFADWFAGFISKKGTVKSESRGFYNQFRSAYKPFFKALRQSDRAVTSKYIKKGKR